MLKKIDVPHLLCSTIPKGILSSTIVFWVAPLRSRVDCVLKAKLKNYTKIINQQYEMSRFLRLNIGSSEKAGRGGRIVKDVCLAFQVLLRARTLSFCEPRLRYKTYWLISPFQDPMFAS